MKTPLSTGVSVLADPQAAALEALDMALNRLDAPEIALLLAFCTDGYDASVLLHTLRARLPGVPIAGSTVYGGFNQSAVHPSGVYLAVFAAPWVKAGLALTQAIDQHPEPAAAIYQSLRPLLCEGDAHELFLLFSEGFGRFTDETLLLLRTMLPGDPVIAGGLTYKLHSAAETSRVFHQENQFETATSAVRMTLQHPVYGAVCHGHTLLPTPMIVTRAEGRHILEIDGKPAWLRWREVIQTSIHQRDLPIELPGEHDDRHLRLLYQLGLKIAEDRTQCRYIVRVVDNALEMSSPIPVGSTVQVLDDDSKEGHILAARRSVQMAKAAAAEYGYTRFGGALILECALRQFLLDDQFPKAVDAIREELGEVPFLGVELGAELLLRPEDFGGYNNASTVAILFPMAGLRRVHVWAIHRVHRVCSLASILNGRYPTASACKPPVGSSPKRPVWSALKTPKNTPLAT